MKFAFLTTEFYIPAVLGIFFLLTVTAVKAQTSPALIPHFNCVEPIYTNGELTQFKAYFGYTNTSAETIVIQQGLNNFLLPPSAQNRPTTTFLPGRHEKSFSAVIAPSTKLTWFINNESASSENDWAAYCSGGLMTYQGKLSNGGAAANGNYDLQVEFYDLATGGTSQGGKIRAENVPVVNGIFTVQLDVGAVFNMKSYFPRFVEIGVRPANNGNEDFTILAPRQPVTSVPYAINAQNAARLGGMTVNSFLTITDANTNLIRNSTTAQNANINITGTVTSGCKSGFNAFSGGRLCVSDIKPAATFYGVNGAMQTCINSGARVGTTADVTLTLSNGGFNYFSNLPQGWLGDYAGDNLRPVWNIASPNPDFDGSPLNVLTGGSNGTAPVLPYRCVY